MTQSGMTKKGKAIFLTAFSIITVISFAIIFLISNKIEEDLKEEVETTLSLSPAILNIIRAENSQNLKNKTAMPKAVKFRKYLYLKNSPLSDKLSNCNYTHCYEKEINEKLNTHINVGNDIDGLILQDIGFMTTGYYETDNTFGRITEKEDAHFHQKSARPANRVYAILTYVNVPDGIVLHRDTVWGGDPPETIKNSDSGTGPFPEDEEIIHQIRNTITL